MGSLKKLMTQRKLKFVVGGFAGSVFMLFLPIASAAPILDQSSTDISLTSYSPSTSQHTTWKQGVTAGVGGRLTRLDYYVTQSGGGHEINLYSVGPADIGVSLASVLINPVIGWNSIDLSSASIFFNAGDEFSFGVHNTSPNAQIAGSSLYAGAYSGGMAVFDQTLYTDGRFDLAFRTYMETQTGQAPVPTTFALFAIGLAVFGSRQLGKPNDATN